MIAVLGRLKLERIQLTLTDFYDFFSWERFPATFKKAFLACISTPHMKEINLDLIRYVPLGVFADCEGLQHLTLYHAISLSNKSFQFPQLATLELSDWGTDYVHDLFPWLQAHACGLRSLTLTTFMERVICKFLPRFLAICATSLVNLNIYYNTSKAICPVT